MASSYDRAITIFSPDGRLFQVDYAQEAVKKGSTAVGVKGKDCIVIGVEKKSVPVLQDDRTIRKIHKLDDHVMAAFAGLECRRSVSCENYKLTLEDPVTLEHISRSIADLKHEYTQTTGRRPFGVSMIIGGFDPDGTPHLFISEPSGVYYELLAGSIGKNEKVVKEYLENNYKDETVANEDLSLKLVIKALVPVVQTGARNMEIAIMTRDNDGNCIQRLLTTEEITAVLRQIEAEPMETA
ncbi:Proteasome subunit alpha type [Meloidogyne graminicola]|uniref:Proteasome subunit alpha type n=1 Tax=Meloidogyne graminicola TaxID=189291 RepID=A0A8S9ZZS1_9BILA|nr:Proteasome subunit alpha type [Meloidogyne graminicola]